MKKKTLSILFALFISCTLFVACGKDEIVEVVAPIESVETVEPIETTTEETDTSVEESTETVAEIESVVAETVSEEVATDNIEIVEELDQMMYAQKNCNARNGDGTNYDKVASIEKSAYVHVTGRTSNDWYRVEWEGVEEGVVYISGSLLGLNKPTSDSGSNNNSGNGNSGNSGSTNNGGSGSNTNTGGNSGTTNPDGSDSRISNIFGGGTGGFGGEYGGSWDY